MWKKVPVRWKMKRPDPENVTYVNIKYKSSNEATKPLFVIAQGIGLFVIFSSLFSSLGRKSELPEKNDL